MVFGQANANYGTWSIDFGFMGSKTWDYEFWKKNIDLGYSRLYGFGSEWTYCKICTSLKFIFTYLILEWKLKILKWRFICSIILFITWSLSFLNAIRILKVSVHYINRKMKYSTARDSSVLYMYFVKICNTYLSTNRQNK